MTDDRHEAVSRRAYELWEQEGGGHGRHEDHWHRASGELDADPQARPARTSQAAKAPAARTAAKPAKPAAAKPAKPKPVR